jgi:hypothetical protein
MFSFLALALAVASCTSALVIPRASPPEGWSTDYLEVRYYIDLSYTDLIVYFHSSRMALTTLATWLFLASRSTTPNFSINVAVLFWQVLFLHKVKSITLHLGYRRPFK